METGVTCTPPALQKVIRGTISTASVSALVAVKPLMTKQDDRLNSAVSFTDAIALGLAPDQPANTLFNSPPFAACANDVNVPSPAISCEA